MNSSNIDYVFLGKGRMNRMQYLNIFILLSLIGFFLNLIVTFINFQEIQELHKEGQVTFYSILFASIFVTILTPFITSIFIRRGHDFGIPTSVGIIFGILYWAMNALTGILIALGYSVSANVTQNLVLQIMGAVYGLLLVFYPGKKESNNYGDQPKSLRKMGEIIRFWWTGKV